MSQTVTSAFHQVTSLAPAVVALAAALYAANVVFCALRWRAALWALGEEVSVRTTTLGTLCSVFVNNVTPGRVAGEMFRVGWLKHREGIELARGTASVAVDRLTDLVPIGLIGLLSLPTLRPYIEQLSAPLILVAALTGIALVVVVVTRRVPTLKARLAQVRTHIVGRVEKRARKLAIAILLAALAWLLDLARLSLIAHAFGFELGVPEAAMLVVMIIVGSLVPTVGGLGAVEGALAGALVWLGAPTDTALAITLVERAISYGLSTAAGGLTLLLLGGRKLWTTLQDRSAEPVPSASEPSDSPARVD
jgi:uncharacterized membrane protein YbhN (UPF0104 family)